MAHAYHCDRFNHYYYDIRAHHKVFDKVRGKEIGGARMWLIVKAYDLFDSKYNLPREEFEANEQKYIMEYLDRKKGL